MTPAPVAPIPAKWQMLPATHPTVLRRLAKELNHRSNGFYSHGERWTQAKFSKGRLMVLAGFEGKWTDATGWTFDDGYGNEITASRTVCGH